MRWQTGDHYPSGAGIIFETGTERYILSILPVICLVSAALTAAGPLAPFGGSVI